MSGTERAPQDLSRRRQGRKGPAAPAAGGRGHGLKRAATAPHPSRALPRPGPIPPAAAPGEGGPWIGRSRLRVEDERLLTGRGRFVGDVAMPGCLHLAFLRSAYPCGIIKGIDASAAAAMPGVVAVYAAPDLRALGKAAVNPLVPGMQALPFAPLATGTVEAVGQPIAAVVAETAAAAHDAIEAIDLDCDAQAAASGADAAAPIAQAWTAGDADAAFAVAAHVARVTVRHARLAGSPLEPRAALARWDAQERRLTVWLSTQTPHRARQDLAAILRLDPERVRVVAPDVGGAFGAKASLFPEDAVVAWAAMTLRRPVRWQGSRAEDLLAGTHGRGGTLEGALAFDREGNALALRARLAFPLGHWMPFSAAVPARNAARVLPGPYRVGALDVRMDARPSNTAAVGIYRGAGRPEAAMLLERLMDLGARQLGLDPSELRRRNLHPAHLQPRRTPLGETVDSGDHEGLLDRALALADYPALRARQASERAAGRPYGVGIGLYIEPCGQGWESAKLRLAADGRIVLATGSSAQGQGRETAYAQIAADILGIAPDRITVEHGDTATAPPGIGALASRSTAIGGSAVKQAASEFLAEATAAGLKRRGRGVPDWDGLARALAASGAHLPSASLVYEAAGEAWSGGCCVAAVAIDRETGVPVVERLAWADDAGTVVNPMLVEGQLLGGAAQGLGEALLERIVYDRDGQLLTGSLMDYALPRAGDMPPVALASLATPSPANALGAKGVGEAGTIGVPAAIANAVLDALAPFGVAHLDMPLTSERIWRALEGKPATGGMP
ncbi:MAG: xanthine dehydrogenase family protein [Alphaproteobacteria bacterium]|nr:xanthine dehydrogenase family protein [Alphaproteobacteria bacterium]